MPANLFIIVQNYHHEIFLFQRSTDKNLPSSDLLPVSSGINKNTIILHGDVPLSFHCVALVACVVYLFIIFRNL